MEEFIYTVKRSRNELLLEYYDSPNDLGDDLRKKFQESAHNLQNINLDDYIKGDTRKRTLIDKETYEAFYKFYNGNRKTVGRACAIIYNQLLNEKLK